MPPRSATAPIPMRVPSPDLPIAQDCAFPPFPTSRSRSATPTTPATPVETTFAFLNDNARSQSVVDPGRPTQSRRPNEGSSLLKRMDSIAPGPFNLGEKTEKWNYKHKEAPSVNSTQDFVRSSSSAGSRSLRSRIQRPSTSSSNYSRNPSLSSSASDSRKTYDLNDSEGPNIPPMPSIQQLSQKEDHNTAASLRSDPSSFDFGTFSQENRSQTFPQESRLSHSSSQGENNASSQRRPSEPSAYSHKPKPSVLAVLQPLHDIGSTSSFKSSRLTRGRNQTPTVDQEALNTLKEMGRSEICNSEGLGNQASVLQTTRVSSHQPEDLYRTPHESTSSTESYSSGVKTSSSRSSPPLNESPQLSKGHALGDSRAQNQFQDFNFNVERQLEFEEPTTHNRSSSTNPANQERPLHQTSSNRPRSVSPTKPTIITRDVSASQSKSLVTSPDEYMVSSYGSRPNNLHFTPAPPPPPPVPQALTRRPTAANKGHCRGCGELIIGKSVSSADGRLTGRYHKQCFVCDTCKEPFQTADFYVKDNRPYCARHYHALNGSLCKSCDRGIEGQYLETELKQKYHSYCFTCQDCHKILRDDYYEWNGKTLCENHAFGAAQQPSSLLGPGRRFPERRTTRLMMM